LHGRLEFDYVYRFFSGTVDPCALYRELQELRAGIPLIFAAAPSEIPCGEWGNLNGNAVLSALKPAADGDGTIIRLFNPGDRDETAMLTLAEPAASAHLCDLAERENSLLCENAGKLEIKVPPQKAVTVKMRFGNR
jgi:alpha-mannosidase